MSMTFPGSELRTTSGGSGWGPSRWVVPVPLLMELVTDQVDQPGGAQEVPGVVDVEEERDDAGQHQQVGHQDGSRDGRRPCRSPP
jgi:hypothetical protein